MSDLHAKLMEQAYDKWSEHSEWGYTDFIENLSPIEKKAVLIGNLNYQVENGGFLQWHYNGYSKYADDVLEILDEFSNYDSRYTEVGSAVRNIVEEAIGLLDLHSKCDAVLHSEWNVDAVEEVLDSYTVEYAKSQARDAVAGIESIVYEYLKDRNEDLKQEILDTLGTHGVSESTLKEIEYYLDESDSVETLLSYVEDYIAEDYLYDEMRQVYDSVVSDLDHLDKRYYSVNDRFLELFNEYLERQVKAIRLNAVT